jgi:hypothetical protein
MPEQGAQEKRLEDWLMRQFSAPEPNWERIAARTVKEPPLVAELIRLMGERAVRVKYGASKTLLIVAGKEPGLVYPWFDFFTQLLDSENNVFRWTALRMLASLARADAEGRTERVLGKHLSVIPGPQMIAAGNAIAGAAEIALAKPELADRLAGAILGVQRAVYDTVECRNIAIGHAIVALDRFFGIIPDKKAVADFVEAQLDNTRSGTRKKAQAFLKRNAPAKAVARA